MAFGASSLGSILVGILAIVFATTPSAKATHATNSQSADAVILGDDKDAKDLAKYDAKITPGDRRHWAFQSVKRPVVPKVKSADWVRNPIDAFVLAKLEQKGWKPADPVEPRVWLRRVYLDVTGLPPTLAEQDAFLMNPTHAAMDAVVKDLLSRPSYGERWGRHWLDVVRYAETSGYERDAVKPNVWRYRDYVIRSFNDDKPYDRFVMEQLAGDELDSLPSPHRGRGAGGEGVTADSLTALGFNRLGPWDDEPADPKEDRFDQLDDVVNATSLVFMGTTLACARCHNHKFEALTMHDYYRMVAIFNPLVRPAYGRTELDLPVGTLKEIERQKDRDRQIALLMKGVPKGKAAPANVEELRRAIPDLPRGYFLHEPSSKPPTTHLLIRGKATRPGPAVAPGVPAVLVAKQPSFPEPAERSSMRRLTLAKWLVSPDHPLTARVMVNRIWHYHFGEGIVRTPNDFGLMGQSPTHPELLDWLASEFSSPLHASRDGKRAEPWSIKHLHYLILTSNSYRMSKRWNAGYAKTDPENLFLWRFPYKRLEIEAIRDSALFVSGQLNPKMFGPSMYPEVPKEALEGNSDPDKIWKPFDEKEAARRTVYAHIKRGFVVPLLETFDLCDTTRPNDKRLTTTVAPQALSLFNGSFINRQAKHFAERLRKEAGNDADKQLDHAYRLALCRPPTATERTVLRDFLKRQSLEQMCRVILNLNEFAYAD
ncbi:MAG: DUF1553 domain-containing protein [Planctomycetes bacterium]|nr:DUF1553 domain-containing protein [Planctomycetota bacterium]